VSLQSSSVRSVTISVANFLELFALAVSQEWGEVWTIETDEAAQLTTVLQMRELFAPE
jgi:hypothetical protein